MLNREADSRDMKFSSEKVLPIYQLFGEENSWPHRERYHCEAILERNADNDFDIHVHWHTDILHILYIETGRGKARIEGRILQFNAPAVIIVPALTVHGFEFEQSVSGYSLSIKSSYVSSLSQTLGENANILDIAGQYPLLKHNDVSFVNELIKHINDEFKSFNMGRDTIAHALIEALIVMLSRCVPKGYKNTESLSIEDRTQRKNKKKIFIRLLLLIDQHHSEHPQVSFFSSKLGLGGSYLNMICNEFSNLSIIALVHQRLIDEAKRYLIYTDLSISSISDRLGFSEPAYFSRFFKNKTGISPRHFKNSDELPNALSLKKHIPQ